MNETESTYDKPRHPIQVVSTRTGLSKDVIRIWERRYQAITPARSDSGRRLYADADIDRLLKLKKTLSRGWRIGDVAALPDAELEELVAAEAQPSRVGPAAGESHPAESYLSRCLAAVEEMSPSSLASLLSAASVALSLPRLLDDLVAPLLVEIGDRWHRGDLRVGHEHMASSVIRTFLDNLRESANMQADGPTILVTTPGGQNHEMGALMAAVAAATAGWRAMYLIPNLPVRDIAAAATQTNARAVALSLAYPADDPRIAADLRFLGQQLAAGVSLIVGGQAAASYRSTLDEIGALYLTELKGLMEVLGELRARPSV